MIRKKQHEHLQNHSLIKVDVIGQFVRKTNKKTGISYEPLYLWCGFYNDQTSQLMYASGRVDNPGEPAETDTYKLAAPTEMINSWTNLKDQYEDRVNAKLKQGLSVLEGEWFVIPETGRLFNREAVDRQTRLLMLIRNVGRNGFGPGPYSESVDDFLGEKRPPNPITQRLAEANPIAQDWFFATG